MADFPPSDLKEDSQYHGMTYEDNVLRHTTEGGNMYARPRSTGKPARIWTTGFTYIDPLQKIALEAFYQTYQAFSFGYDIPSDEFGGVIETVGVKFTGPFSFTYVGIGELRRWNVDDITLREDI